MESHWAESREARQGTHDECTLLLTIQRIMVCSSHAKTAPRPASNMQKNISRIFSEIDGIFLLFLISLLLFTFPIMPLHDVTNLLHCFVYREKSTAFLSLCILVKLHIISGASSVSDARIVIRPYSSEFGVVRKFSLVFLS